MPRPLFFPFFLRSFVVWMLSSMLTAGPFESTILPLLEGYCLDCHDSQGKSHGLDLTPFATEGAALKDRSIWQVVYEKVESHQMPPPKRGEQPTTEERTKILDWIMQIASLPDPALRARDPGKPILRRLTRLEYHNSIRDLFGLDIAVFMFPEQLPFSNKDYFQPATGSLGDVIDVPVIEYGLKRPMLMPDLGIPGENRAEHGFRNRGSNSIATSQLVSRATSGWILQDSRWSVLIRSVHGENAMAHKLWTAMPSGVENRSMARWNSNRYSRRSRRNSPEVSSNTCDPTRFLGSSKPLICQSWPRSKKRLLPMSIRCIRSS